MDRSGDGLARRWGLCVERRHTQKRFQSSSIRMASMVRISHPTRRDSSWQPPYGTQFGPAKRKRVLTLRHEVWVSAAKYSPQGNQIATATPDSIRVWDSNNGHLLMDIKVGVTPWYNTGLLWFDDRIFVVSDGKIKQIEASTGSVVSAWPVSKGDGFSCITLPQHGDFIAYSTRHTITFWDPATHIQLSHIQYPQKIRSTAISPDDRFIAISGMGGSVGVKRLSRITASIVSRGVYIGISCPNYFSAPCFIPVSHYTPYSRHQSFKSTMPCSIRGNTIVSRDQKRY